MTERFANEFTSTLAEVVDDVEDEITLSDAPPDSLADGTWRLRIGTLPSGSTEPDYELCIVSAQAGSVVTVERGAEGTTAQEWPLGTPVAMVVTAAVLTGFVQVLRATVEVSAAQMLAMGEVDNVPVSTIPLVAAPGAGRVIVVRSIRTLFRMGTQPYGGGWASSFRYGAGGRYVTDLPPGVEGVNDSLTVSPLEVGTLRNAPPDEVANKPIVFAIEVD